MTVVCNEPRLTYPTRVVQPQVFHVFPESRVNPWQVPAAEKLLKGEVAGVSLVG